MQVASMVPKIYASVGQMSTEANQEEVGSWILEKQDLTQLQQWTVEWQQAAKDLLCRLADIFFKSDLDLDKCKY